jgi:hypothetical protein
MTLAAAPSNGATLPDWIQAYAAGIGVIVALVALLLTLTQVRLTGRQLREASEQQVRDSEAQTRPYVGADVVTSLFGSPMFDLVIHNYGKTTARGVKLRLVENTFSAKSQYDEIGPALGRLFAEPFDLAPGSRRRVLWLIPDSKNAEPRGDMGAPVADELILVYGWDSDGIRPERSYTEHYSYDLSEYAKLVPSPNTGPKATGAGSSEKNIAHALRALTEHVAELRR